MVINIQPPKVNSGTIKFRETWRFFSPRGLALIAGNFTTHLPEVGLLNMRGLGRQNFKVVPLHFTHRDRLWVHAILIVYHTSPWVESLLGIICFKSVLFHLSHQQDFPSNASPLTPANKTITLFLFRNCSATHLSLLCWQETVVLFYHIFCILL